MNETTVGLVLAAGAASRFGGGKLLATIGGRPMLQHVLDAMADAGVGEVVVVLGDDAAAIDGASAWRGEHRVVNPDPGRGLASSLQVGFEAVPATAKAVLVAVGDQPLVSGAVIEALLDGKADAARPVAMPTYDDERGRNPVLLRRAAFGLVAEASGDRGLGPVLAAHPEMVAEVPAV